MAKSESKKQVIVIGAGLTGLTLAYYLKKAGINVLVIEKNSAPGGAIQSHQEKGFLFESGPNTGVLSSYEIAELFADLKDGCTLLQANPNAKQRWIWKKGRWHALPSGPISAVRTPLFTFGDKLRILKEPWVKKGHDRYESVAGLVRRRMGESFLNYAVDPFISGIYAGDPEQLTTKFALPKLYQLEQDYGSFIRGALKKRKIPKSEQEKKATREVFSVEGGLSELIAALVKQIGEKNILYNCNNTEVAPVDGGFNVGLEQDGSTRKIIEAECVVSTIGAHQLSHVLPFVKADVLKHLTNLKYAKVVQVAAGYKQWNGIKLNAFGGLIPSRENNKVLGILFPSAIFAKRAPEGGALLSVFMGGARNPNLIKSDDAELKKVALDNIHLTMGVKSDPDLLKIFRYYHAIPQYEASSEERLKAIYETEKEYPGLIIAGNLRDGIGMSDRVKQALQISGQITRRFSK